MSQPIEAPTPAYPSIDKVTQQINQAAAKLENTVREQFVDSKTLCSSCRWSTLIRQSSRNVLRIRCNSLAMWMPDDVAECSAYTSVNGLTLGQMMVIALPVNDKERSAGFYF